MPAYLYPKLISKGSGGEILYRGVMDWLGVVERGMVDWGMVDWGMVSAETWLNYFTMFVAVKA